MTFHLRNLPIGAKLGILCALLVLFGGYEIAAVKHLMEHHSPRDGEEGFSLADVEGVYHGVNVESSLRGAIERGHPENLPEEERQALLDWLRAEPNDIRSNYDNFDLGDFAPAEIIARSCVSCHARSSRDEVARALPLENFTDVEAIAFSRNVPPMDPAILLASMHAHAPVMALITIVVALLACMSGWAPGWLRGGLVLLAGAALLLDMASWFPARTYASLSWAIMYGGIAHSVSMGLLMLIVAIELLLPRRRSQSES
jgi:hypothetical protein